MWFGSIRSILDLSEIEYIYNTPPCPRFSRLDRFGAGLVLVPWFGVPGADMPVGVCHIIVTPPDVGGRKTGEIDGNVVNRHG